MGQLVRSDDDSVGPDYLRRREFTYNAQGQLESELWTKYYPSINYWKGWYHYFYEWDAAGRLLRDSTLIFGAGAWHPASSRYYTYNAAGQLTDVTSWNYGGAQPSIEGTTTITYNAAGQRLTMLSKTTSTANGPLENDFMYSYGYSGNQQTYSGFYMWRKQQSPPAWEYVWDEQRHYNAAGQPDSIMTHYISQVPVDSFATRIFYNSDGLPVRQHIFGGGQDREERYYYEPYAVHVEDMGVKALGLYPNPANDKLQFRVFDNAQGQIACRIINQTGALVQTSSGPAGSPEITLDISALPAGLYFLIAQDEKGQLASGRFVKQ